MCMQALWAFVGCLADSGQLSKPCLPLEGQPTDDQCVQFVYTETLPLWESLVASGSCVGARRKRTDSLPYSLRVCAPG